MQGSSEKDSGKSDVQLLPTQGSLVGGFPKDKSTRITMALVKMQLDLDGLRSRYGSGEMMSWSESMQAFAETCSIFLRKTVLGNRGRRETRLLDDDILKATGLEFDRLRKIPENSRRTIEVGHCLDGALLKITRLDDRTHEPVKTYNFTAAVQEVKISIEWPLLGTADWIGTTSEELRWDVHPSQLFQENSGGLNCDQWLGQQVVIFDGKSLSLKKIIQTVANFDGAHSINVSRLFTPEGHDPSKAAKDPALTF